MQYSQEQLEKIKELAGLLMRPDHIALLTQIDVEEFKRNLKHKTSEVYIAYETGRANTILELRSQELKLAKLGSPAAVEAVQKFIIDQEIDE